MTKIAMIAFPPISAVLFGLFAIALTFSGGFMRHFEWAFSSYMGAAAASVLLAIPLSWLVARRMMTRRDKRIADMDRQTAL